ncbi:cytochrome P450 [Xylaria cf. heliscus]|nr:cytochrome P450 [Xylaria cf. heliscus]
MHSRLLTIKGATLCTVALSLMALRFHPDFMRDKTSLHIVFYISCLNFGVLWLYSFLIYPFFLSPLRHLQGPKTAFAFLPRTLLQLGAEPGKPVLDLMDRYPDDDLLLVDILRDQLVLTKPSLLADLFVHRPYDFIKPLGAASFLKESLGIGLVTAEGEQHKFLRKNSLPAFGFRHIKDLYPMMWRKSSVFAGMLLSETNADKIEQIGDKIVDISIASSKVTLDIIGLAGLGREFDTIHNAEDPLAQAYEELLKPSFGRAAYFVMCSLFGIRFVQLLPWSINNVMKRLKSTIMSTCSTMLREKRDAIKNNEAAHIDILSLLIKSNNFSDSELTDQLMTLLAAGHETTSSSLSWACYLLTKHQDILAVVREEVQRELALDMSGAPSVDIASTLERLPYLNGVINETLRLYPTVPLTQRSAIRDTQIGQYRIPKGANIIVSIWAMNRSPSVWGSDSTKFRPDRWITNNKPNHTGGADSNYQFLTFLHRPRSCIGQGFARAERRCLLASMVLSCNWELAMSEKDVVPGGTITIKPAKGLFLRLKPLKAT